MKDSRFRAFSLISIAAAAAVVLSPGPAEAAGGIILRTLANKAFWTSVGASTFYDQVLDRALSQLIGANENTTIDDAFLESINVDTFLFGGAFSFYTDTNGNIVSLTQEFNSFADSNQVDKSFNFNANQTATSIVGAPFSATVSSSISTDNGIFFDDKDVNVSTPILTTGTLELTGETLYAGAFGFAFIDDEFSATPLAFASKPLRVPESIPMLSTGIVLFCASILKRKYSNPNSFGR